MEAAYLEATPVATEAAVERQELHNEEAAVDSIGSLEDRYGDLHVEQRLVERVAKNRGRGPREWWVLEEVGRLTQTNDTPLLPCSAQGT